MTYDGSKYDNCPHCNAPRPLVDCEESIVQEKETVFYSDNKPFYSYSEKLIVPSPYGTVERK